MKNIKRIIALALVFVMIMAFAGCHKKNEIAVKIGDIEFTSAYYMCALLNADTTAKSKVLEGLTDEEKQGEVDYYKQKIDKTDFVKWVENEAINNLKKIAAYKAICKDAKKELKESDVAQLESYAQYYWTSYGYKEYFEPNGVSYDTYLQYMKDGYYADAAFEVIFGKGGEKEVNADDVKAKIYEKYIISDMLSKQFDSEATDDDKAKIKTEFQGYVDEINGGKRSFRDIYISYNEITQEQLDEVDKSEEAKPQDYFAAVLGAADSDNPSEYFDTINALEMGKATLLDMTDGAGVFVAVKQDITADPYYLDSLDSSARHLIADEDFEKYIEDYMKDLKVEKNKSAIKQFKVKKIYEPETESATTNTAAAQ